MFKTIRNAWKLPELRRKLLFVIVALLIFRVGAAIPVPYINTEYLQDYIAANSGTIFGLLNTLSRFGPVPGYVVCPVHPALY